MLGNEKKDWREIPKMLKFSLQSRIIGIFIFPPFLILNQTLDTIYYFYS